MTPDLCLSRREIAALTRTPLKAKQREFLQRNGIRHYLDLHGWPVVLRSAVEGTPAPPADLSWTQKTASRKEPAKKSAGDIFADSLLGLLAN